MRLYIMEMAKSPADGTSRAGAPVPAYLIQTDDGTNVLVDTGFSAEQVATMRAEFGDDTTGSVNLVTDELAKIGVKPEDVRYLIATHLDPDHAGGTDLFPKAEIIVQRAHYDAAKSGEHPRFERARANWDAEGLHYRFVDGDTELLPGIELVESSGHVPGHQSVLVRLPETGPVLLAIDAMTRSLGDTTPETRIVGSFDADADATRQYPQARGPC